eukprot:gene7332-454_t
MGAGFIPSSPRNRLAASLSTHVAPPMPIPALAKPTRRSTLMQCASQIQPPEYWVARRKQRVIAEIMEQAAKSPSTKHIHPTVVEEGINQLDALLPGWVPNLDVMKGSDYVS